MSDQEALLRSVKRLELAHLCGTIASYWTLFIAVSSIIGMIFLPISDYVPLPLVAIPYFTLRLLVILLARAMLEFRSVLSGRFYLASVAAKSSECKESSHRITGTIITIAATALFLYLAYVSTGELTVYFSLTALVMANAGLYLWFVYPYCFALGASLLTLVSVPYALFELYVVKPSPMHLFATMTTTDVLAILGVVTVGVERCTSAKR